MPTRRSETKRLRSLAVDAPAEAATTVSHAFSFESNPHGAHALAAELRKRRFTRVWVGEEVTGDGYWHVAARRLQSLDQRAFANASRTMRRLAVEHGGHYDGWSVLSNGLSLACPQRRPD